MIDTLLILKEDIDNYFKRRRGLKRKVLTEYTTYVLTTTNRNSIDLMFSNDSIFGKKLVKLIATYVKTYGLDDNVIPSLCYIVFDTLSSISRAMKRSSILNRPVYYNFDEAAFKEQVVILKKNMEWRE